MAVNPIPEGYPRVSPYLCCRGAGDAIEFYKSVLGATERMRMPGDSPENIGHAELEIGSSIVMLADEFPDMGHLGPKSRGGPTSSILLYVEDVDTSFNKAINAGATQQRPLENQFWGDRMGTLQDPFGHQWSLASHVEDVSPEEMQKRMEQFSSQKQPEPA